MRPSQPAPRHTHLLELGGHVGLLAYHDARHVIKAEALLGRDLEQHGGEAEVVEGRLANAQLLPEHLSVLLRVQLADVRHHLRVHRLLDLWGRVGRVSMLGGQGAGRWKGRAMAWEADPHGPSEDS
jgi:hypothetical protein